MQKQIRASGFRPASVERKSVERRSAFAVTTLYALTLHAFRALAGHNVRLTPKVWKLFLHELLEEGSLMDCLPFCLQPPDGEVAAFLSFPVSGSTRSLSDCPAPPATASLASSFLYCASHHPADRVAPRHLGSYSHRVTGDGPLTPSARQTRSRKL